MEIINSYNVAAASNTVNIFLKQIQQMKNWVLVYTSLNKLDEKES